MKTCACTGHLNSATEVSNTFEPIQEDEAEEYAEWLEMQDQGEKSEDELMESDLQELEAFRAQIEEERALSMTFRDQAAEERAMILTAQAHCAIAGGSSFSTVPSDPKTADSTNASSSGFWGHSTQR